MTEKTRLDAAQSALAAAPDDTTARMRYFERLADSALHLPLEAPATRDRIEPHVARTGAGDFVLAFDREDRLAGFLGDGAETATLPGRSLIRMLAGQGVGIGINLGTPFEQIISAGEIAWLAETLDHGPSEAEARPVAFEAPGTLPDALFAALDGKLAQAEGLARSALLGLAQYEDGTQGHLLAFLDAAPQAEGPLSRAVAEALVFSGLEAGALDVTFLRSETPQAQRLAQVALRFDLPDVVHPQTPGANPGMNPEKPPKLR